MRKLAIALAIKIALFVIWELTVDLVVGRRRVESVRCWSCEADTILAVVVSATETPIAVVSQNDRDLSRCYSGEGVATISAKDLIAT